MIVGMGRHRAGKTMARLMTAPRSSTFVCPEDNVGYIQLLADCIGRYDLHIANNINNNKQKE